MNELSIYLNELPISVISVILICVFGPHVFMHLHSYIEYQKCKNNDRYLEFKKAVIKIENGEGTIIFYDGNLNPGKVWWINRKYKSEDDIDYEDLKIVFSQGFLCSKSAFTQFGKGQKLKQNHPNSTYLSTLVVLSRNDKIE